MTQTRSRAAVNMNNCLEDILKKITELDEKVNLVIDSLSTVQNGLTINDEKMDVIIKISFSKPNPLRVTTYKPDITSATLT